MSEKGGIIDITDERFRDRLWLVQRGVPYDLARDMTPEEVFSHVIVFGEMEGGKFDWEKMRWKTEAEFGRYSRVSLDGAMISREITQQRLNRTGGDSFSKNGGDVNGDETA